MIEKRTEAAARENINVGGCDLLEMDMVQDSAVAVSGLPLAAEPLFTLSPITPPQAALPPHEALFNASPIACPPSEHEHDTDVLMQELEKSWSPVLVPSQLGITTQTSPVQPSWSPHMSPHLLRSQPVLDTVPSTLLLPPWSPIPTKSPLTREQSEELPMLDQAWSRPRPTARDRGQPPRSVQRRRPQTPSVYRRNHGYSIADDIEASMREEEDDAMASPSAGNSTPFIPFTFSPPSRRLFTHPGARPRVTKTYATQARGAQSSPPYKATSSTNPQ